MPAITPDLQQNIFVTIYLLFSHNYIALAYFIGMMIGIGLAIWKPSRFSVFVLLGFAVLLFSYEYDKHIIEAFRQQTLNSLVTVTPHYKATKVINVLITELLPVLLYVSGWALIFVSIVYAGVHLGKKKK